MDHPLGYVECWPCSVWAWCDRPVYHPGPECDHDLLKDYFPDHWVPPEAREPYDFNRDRRGCLRALPDDLAAQLSPELQQERLEAQKQYEKWWVEVLGRELPACEMGFGVFTTSGLAAEAKHYYDTQAEKK
jgi:hypothetical protein